MNRMTLRLMLWSVRLTQVLLPLALWLCRIGIWLLVTAFILFLLVAIL